MHHCQEFFPLRYDCIAALLGEITSMLLHLLLRELPSFASVDCSLRVLIVLFHRSENGVRLLLRAPRFLWQEATLDAKFVLRGSASKEDTELHCLRRIRWYGARCRRRAQTGRYILCCVLLRSFGFCRHEFLTICQRCPKMS